MPYLTDLSFGPETRIVLIGTTECPNDPEMLPPVPHAKRNIDQLSQLFTDPAVCGLDPGCIVPIVDRDQASQIAVEVDRACKEATDTLVVYYVGHGLYGNADVPIYLAAKQTTESSKKVSGLSIDLIRGSMRDSPARKRVLILDCCYSGRVFDNTLAGKSKEAVLEPAIDLEGTFGIAAVAGNKKALAPPDEEFTRFTGALVNVLKRGIETENKTLELGEVFDEVQRRIGRKGDAPLPKRVNFDRGEKFVLARNRFIRPLELESLYKAIEELRETVASAGARLQSVETKIGDVDGITARLSALEARPIGSSSGQTRPSLDRLTYFLGLSDDEWAEVPNVPYKIQLRRAFNGRSNAQRFSMAVVCAGLTLMGGVITSSNRSDTPLVLGSIMSLAILGSLPTLVGIFKKSSRQAFTSRYASSEASPKFLDGNAQIMELMERRIIKFFGFDMDKQSVDLASFLALVFCMFSTAVWLNKLAAW